ncbi:MAG TPA: hypothetical protein VI456_09395 [Polyangia bacterium]
MKKLSYLFVSGLASTLMLVGAGTLTVVGGACSSGGSSGKTGGSSGTGTGGAGGSGSGSIPIPPNYLPLPSSPTGFVDDTTGGSNVIGAWYAYGDSVGPAANTTSTDAANSDCQSPSKGGFPASACSVILSPTAGKPFVPADLGTSAMCTSGTAAVVMNKGSAADYTDLWGAGIGLDFNNPGGDAGVKGYLDLSAYKGIYFQFYTFPSSTTDPMSNGAGPPSMAMRVNFPNQKQHVTDSPYWMGATKMSSPLTSPGGAVQEETVLWSDVGGPLYLTTQNPPVDLTPYPFDTTGVQAIQFQVFTNTTSATPYSFCVANLALIPK